MKILGFVFVLALALGAGFYIYRDFARPLSEVELRTDADKPADELARPSVGQAGGQEMSWPLPVPELDRPLNITENLPPAMQKEAGEYIAALVIRLKENPQLYSHWIDLGLYRKLIEDFAGALEAWEYASRLQPEEGLPFHNLGDLYNFNLKNFPKAEENYLKAIANAPEEIFYYEKLYEFYRFSKKDEIKAREILEKGISQNPNTSERLRWLLDAPGASI